MNYVSNPSNFVSALARGLDVLMALTGGQRRQTLTEVAAATGLTRGTARRLLLTLQALNYVSGDGKHFWLTPKVMAFSNGYLLQSGLAEAARDVLPKLSAAVGENTSLAVLDEPDIVYLQRHEMSRIFSSGLEPGARLPAHCTSMGRVMLAALSTEERGRFLDDTPLVAETAKTITRVKELDAVLTQVATQGFCVVDGELEDGLRSVAVPVRDGAGAVVAALNISAGAGRTALSKLNKDYVPHLRAAAQEIERNLKRWGK